MLLQIQNNWVCWAILALAMVVYHLLWLDILHFRQHRQVRAGFWHEMTPLLLAALPLLGLLGTIIGLLEAFRQLGNGSADALSGAIGDALLTTQLGLVCVIPAWLMQARLDGKHRVSSEQRQVMVAGNAD